MNHSLNIAEPETGIANNFPDELAEPGTANLQERIEALQRHALKIAGFVALCVFLTAVYVLRLPKLYDSTAVIRVDPSAPAVVVGQPLSQAAQDNSALMATEQDQIRSPNVLIPVINNLKLAESRDLGYIPPAQGNAQALVDGVPHSLLTAMMNSLTVTRPASTYLLQITFRARSAYLAAAVANAVAASVIRHDYETRSQALRSSSQYLTQQSQELRASMEKSQVALQEFERDNGITNPEDRFSLTNQRLGAIASDLDKQRSQERQLDSDLALVRSGDLDAILASPRGDALKSLIESVRTEELTFASIAARYGPADSTYKEEQRRLSGYRSALQSELGHITNQISDQAKAQQALTASTQAAYNDQLRELQDLNTRASQFGLLKQQADSQAKLYDDMQQRIQQADISAGYHSDDLRVVQTALPDPAPAYPRLGLSVLLAFFLSSLAGVAFVLIAISFDRTLSDPASVLAGTGERLIASLPYEPSNDRLANLWHPAPQTLSRNKSIGAFAEAVFTLRTSLFLGANTQIKSLALTSAQPRDGKTTTCVSLAAASARNGALTVIVDADLRRPSVHRLLGKSNHIGLSSYLLGQAALDEILLPTELPNLWVVPAGPAVNNSTELLTKGISAPVEALKDRFSMVFLDCPPVLGFADSLILAPVADAVAVVVRAASTPREYVRASVEQLRHVRANVAGLILNGVSSKTNTYYRYYRDYAAYYSPSEESKAKAAEIE